LARARVALARAVAVPAHPHAPELPAALARLRRPRRASVARLLPRHERAVDRQAGRGRAPADFADAQLRGRSAAAVRRTRPRRGALTFVEPTFRVVASPRAS